MENGMERLVEFFECHYKTGDEFVDYIWVLIQPPDFDIKLTYLERAAIDGILLSAEKIYTKQLQQDEHKEKELQNDTNKNKE